jgi:preprotein translocase subunit SecE
VSTNPSNWAEDGRQFVGEVQAEFKKVTWPSQKETVAGAVSVLVISVLVGIALSVVDFGLIRLMSTLLP